MREIRTGLMVAMVLAGVLPAGAEEEVSFNKDVRQIISDKCFKCHGPDAENQKSDFRLDTFEHATEDLGGYAGVVPGNLEHSEMHHLIHSDDPDERMPPAKSKMSLTEKEKDILDAWIKQGAKYEKHWAFVEVPEEVEVPAAGEGWARNEIDRFVFEELEKQGFEPAEEVTKEKWLRRVTFDLTGLPPTLEELDAFLADEGEKAYEKVVDRLLKSVAYAERMTSEWMDVARYSDSFGYQRDHERRVWPWRDWVIGAFEENMGYDEFVTLQLAGDLLPDAGVEEILPTAFNRLHAHKMEGGIVLEEYRVEYVADRTQTFASAFLGLTMDCARCHDHKYDPLPARDYYALSAFFANIEEAGLISYFTEETPTPAVALPDEKQAAALEAAEKGIAAKEAELKAVVAESATAFEEWLQARPTEVDLPGLVGAVDFEELKEGKTLNSVKPDVPVTSSSENVVVPGKFGNAFKLTGDDPINVPEVGHFSREHPFSASIWLKPDKIVERANVISRGGGGDDAAHLGYEMLLLDGKPTASLIHFWPGNAIRIQAKEPLTAGDWHHVVMTYDGSSRAGGLTLYVNGEAVETEIVKDHLNRQITQWTGGRLDLVIGQRYRDSGLIKGEVDAFRMFDREISGVEARQLFDGKRLAELLRKPVGELTAGEKEQLRGVFLAQPDGAVAKARKALQEARKAWNTTMDEVPDISIMRETPTPRKAYVLNRGAYDARGEEVQADTPTALPPFPEGQPRNRLGLAKWLTDADHPLMGRVTVNRYWALIFGEGLVRTPEDFGRQGPPPTHPELLDWMTRDFVENGWDLHRLLKRMVLSSTYRQSTVVSGAVRDKDPENFYLGRMNPQRLAAEMIRDNALATSGLLSRKVGGEPVKPYEVAVSFKPVEADKGEGLYRRSVYTWWKRNAPAPVMAAFDAAKRDVCALTREQTASPLQPLVLLNGTQFTEASRVLGTKLVGEFGTDAEGMVKKAFRLLTSREPDAREVEILTALHGEQLEEFRGSEEEAKKLLAIGEAPLGSDADPAELAAAAVLVNSIMNLDEAVLKR